MSSKFPMPGKANRHAKVVKSNGNVLTKAEADQFIAERHADNFRKRQQARELARKTPVVTEQQKVMRDGRWDFYRCKACAGFFVTVQRDAGLTPELLGCKATVGCEGQMVSAFFPDPKNWSDLVPRRAMAMWVDPSPMELPRIKREAPALFEFVKKGGLVLAATNDSTPPFPIEEEA